MATRFNRNLGSYAQIMNDQHDKFLTLYQCKEVVQYTNSLGEVLNATQAWDQAVWNKKEDIDLYGMDTIRWILNPGFKETFAHKETLSGFIKGIQHGNEVVPTYNHTHFNEAYGDLVNLVENAKPYLLDTMNFENYGKVTQNNECDYIPHNNLV